MKTLKVNSIQELPPDAKTIRMPQKFLDKWLKALRSGEYPQGKEALYDPRVQGYCCLGVAVACHSKGRISFGDEMLTTAQIDSAWWHFLKDSNNAGSNEVDAVGDCYPSTQFTNKHRLTVRGPQGSWDDLHSFNPYVFVDDPKNFTSRWQLVSDLNDSDRYDFNQIADLIEKHTEVIG